MREMHKRISVDDGLAGIAGSCVVRIKSFQPSWDPILPEAGLGQRAGRFPGVLFGCTMKSKS